MRRRAPLDPRIAAALDRDAAKVARPLAAALALSYLAYAISFVATQGAERSPLLVVAWTLAALGFGVFFAIYPRLRIVRGNRCLGLMAVPVILNSVLVVSQVRAPVFTAAPALVVMGFGALLLSPRIFVVITLATIAGWSAVVLTDPTPLTWLPSALILSTSTAIGALAQWGRYRSRVQLEEARASVREAERSLALDDIRRDPVERRRIPPHAACWFSGW